MKLRMLLESAHVDPGLIEITPFARRLTSNNPTIRERDATTGREWDRDTVTGEMMREYIRGVLSISVTFVSSGAQTTKFDDVGDWVVEHLRRPDLLDITIEEADATIRHPEEQP